uniref:Tripartite motif-containing protein 2 n=1 Tax=Magallana gigas TaxID=29159 RepID=K1QWV4_MAGGI
MPLELIKFRKCLTMDPLCHTCEPPVPSSLFCEICDKHLCSTCCGEHLLDESTEHKVVVFKKRKTTIKCKKHSSKICKLFCEQCNIPICPLCTASKEHQTHIVDDIMKSLVNKKTVFQKDLQELESSIYPKCQELASKIPVQKDSRNKNSEKVKEAINIFGENLHKDIDYMIEKLKSELNELDSKDLDLLNKQEDKIRRIISEIIKSIADLKKVRNSNDASLISSYKSRNTELRKLPPKLSVSLPRFTYRKIDKEQLYQHLCLLLMCSIEKEESGYITYSPRSELSFLDRPFIEVPWILAEIMSENQYSFCGSCLNDGEIWISGSDISGKGIMSLYGHRREVMKSIQTNSGELPVQRDDLIKSSQKLKTAINMYGEELHRKIDTIIKRLNFDLEEMNSKHLIVLKKQEDEIKSTISEIRASIADLNILLNSNDISLFSAYTSRNAEFRNLPPKLTISLPRFTPQKINIEQLYRQFGSPTISPTTEEHGFKLDSTGVESSLDRQLIDVPLIISDINTGYRGVSSVCCLRSEQIWMCGCRNIMRLYSIMGEVMKSIETKSGNWPQDIAVTESGDLVYTDKDDKTVNIVINAQIQTVIRLHEWKPRGVCCTSAGDLLVVMDSDDNKQTKIVRYSGSKQTLCIQYGGDRQPLYSSGGTKYISENRNQDICVSDLGANAVVVVNQAGNLRFTYTGSLFTTKGTYNPFGITTDTQSRILTADYINNRIDILDQNGQFLRYIDNCDFNHPYCLCVDTGDNLFVAEYHTGNVKKIQYCM